jgi:hypothetical protein
VITVHFNLDDLDGCEVTWELSEGIGEMLNTVYTKYCQEWCDDGKPADLDRWLASVTDVLVSGEELVEVDKRITGIPKITNDLEGTVIWPGDYARFIILNM